MGVAKGGTEKVGEGDPDAKDRARAHTHLTRPPPPLLNPPLPQAVYHMPPSEDADPASSMPLALQSVFYKARALRGRSGREEGRAGGG